MQKSPPVVEAWSRILSASGVNGGAFSEAESGFMRLALELAKNGEGRVSPNPPVGCVLVKNGRVVGRGWHDRLGGLHAEAAALSDAGAEAYGATAYVTLSPCCSQGRQPPCTDALIRAGIAGAVVAAEDPNPCNCSGLELLRQAGIPVRFGLLREEAEYLARGYFKKQRFGLPQVILKYAMTLDGKIAAASGDSRWISGPESRELVQDMRSRADAVLVGIKTVLADDPLLTVREPVLSRRGGNHPQPLRVVADSRCRLPPGAAMFRPENGPGGKIFVAVLAGADPGMAAELERVGAEVRVFPAIGGGVALTSVLRVLAERGVNNILCEGGGGLAAGLLSLGLVDEIIAFVALKIVGGSGAPGPVGELGTTRIADASSFTMRECRRVGEDLMIRVEPEKTLATSPRSSL
ncbi:MAG: bifunctional diaminohydroxyphosphoribosylaminopyrimidine deaminase/5-amino-6-(5-phosphoribosylamino)uracil reductase RibD [Planctomycetes bacterium]|nr:bifunctional diaminohydroxyphosphoribosylaminopyrimidine deaminase/5-amino-6-(5-phosphoribosylamino)uracil reductase RibD [Planctomycetota bacterium]